MARLRENFKGGTITNNPLLVGATSATSAAFTSLGVVTSPDVMAIVLDPDSTNPEIAHITAHASADNTVTLLRGQEGTTAREHVATTKWLHAPTVTDFSVPLTIKDKLWTPPASPNALDDEFNDSSLAAAWTRIDANATTITYTEANDVLSIKHAGGVADTAGPSHCLVKSLGGLSSPVTIEAAFRFLRRYATNYQMFGLIMTSGTATTSAGTWMMPFAQDAAIAAFTFSIRSWAALNAGEAANHGDQNWETIGGPLYQRLTWVAANTFRAEWSIDGVSWLQFPTADYSRTLTPTHVGFAMSTWSNAVSPGPLGTVEYFRVSV